LVDERGNDVGERHPGEAAISRALATRVITAILLHTAAAMTPDGWMDSGDLAYWANGELFITGRLKGLHH